MTKQIETLQTHTKEYVATMQLGATTPSYDMEHEENETFPTEHITRELIETALQQFIGDIEQVPPTTRFDAEKMQLTLRVVCGKGTYIRALARDLGRAINSGAYLVALRRTQVGDIRVEKCINYDHFQEWLNEQNIEITDK